MDQGRTGDLVLPQGTYVLLQDGASGEVKVVVGPSKVSLADTDKPVVYERESRRYAPNTADKATKVCPAADEGQYIVLTNPISSNEPKEHPPKGKQDVLVKLDAGRRVNIKGPETFALYPGQIADVIPGHQLKSNEYLIIRVYNEDEAQANLGDAVIKTVSSDDPLAKKSKSTSLFEKKDIRTGNLLIIKGTNVSFYIPPTGIEVLGDGKGNYIRNAVTLERLEYCILLDQNGDKRYVKGPAVVFPDPTESFIENKNKKVFKAIELNENMALYIKVIADYNDEDAEGKPSTYYKAGEELFISGKEQKIYFPRPEHAIIKYGDEIIHYASAVPAGEGRYILDKNRGNVKTIKGPLMLMPDPRKEVIVKRALNDKQVSLWFPGNQEAKEYNLELLADVAVEENFSSGYYNDQSNSISAKTVMASAIAGNMHEEMTRKINYTKPRTIQLNTKYEGAVLLNIWPNYAIQIVNRSGDRRVIEGPKMVMLDYDESLDVLELASGKPKSDDVLIKTVYLQTKNNVVSDIITVETEDLVDIDVRISYKIDFEGKSDKWFTVSNYVNLVTQHMRSVVRNSVKKLSVEEFYETATDVIRDIILGKADESKSKRPGRSFEENGMRIYDVEVLNLYIDDNKISGMIIRNKHETIEQNLKLIQKEKEAEFYKKDQQFTRDKIDEDLKTFEKDNVSQSKQFAAMKKLEDEKLAGDLSNQDSLDEITTRKNIRAENKEMVQVNIQEKISGIKTKEVEAQMKAIAPGLIEAMVTSGNVELSRILAQNITAQREQGGGLSAILGGLKGGMEGILDTVKGTPLEARMQKIIDDYNNLKK